MKEGECDVPPWVEHDPKMTVKSSFNVRSGCPEIQLNKTLK